MWWHAVTKVLPMLPRATVLALLCAACVAVPTVIDHANWMRDMLPIIENATILDLSLPGAHDAMTWDMSTDVSDNANDIPEDLADFLHLFGDFLDLGEYMRNQVRGCCGRARERSVELSPSLSSRFAAHLDATPHPEHDTGKHYACNGVCGIATSQAVLLRVQGLNITEQLETGVRFIDFRIVYTLPSGKSASFLSLALCAMSLCGCRSSTVGELPCFSWTMSCHRLWRRELVLPALWRD